MHLARDDGRRPDTADAEWTYWRPAEAGIVELCALHGKRVGLPTHFHHESQLSFVLSGRRRLVIRGEAVDLLPGQGALIPAGVPHCSLPEPSGVVCFNAYLPAGEYAAGAMTEEMGRLWRRAGRIGWPELAEVVRGHRVDVRVAPANPAVPLPLDSCEPVGQIAARALLRAGEAIACVAAETGFADQSHLGRCFRRAFGVTPGRYRGR